MKVSINIVDFGSLNDLLDSPLIWETEYIPLIGDKLEYCNFDETVDFIGKIVERIFIIGTDEVVLEVEVNNNTYDTLSNFFKIVRTKKRINYIVIRKDCGDLEVEVSTENIRLTMEELNLLADKLWRHSWEIDCDLACTNDKLSPYWVFGLFPNSNIDSIAEGIRMVIQDLFPDKLVKIA